MKLIRHTFVIAVVLWLLVRPGNGCSIDPAADVFVQIYGPDAPYGRYVGGRLGVVERSYRVRHLVVAYNYLNGRPLTAAEQRAAVAVNAFFDPAAAGVAFGERAASQAPEQAPGIPLVTRAVPGQVDGEQFPNCLQDAFAQAANTLEQRQREHGADDPEVAEWSRGQAAAFSNCGGPGDMPQPLAKASLWLKQDRAYQIAAAQFYAMDYDAALASFRAIAEDHASPWAPLARYLVARVLIRRGVVPYSFQMNDLSKLEENQRVLDNLGAAKLQLEGILRDPAMRPMHEASERLLDYVEARYEPERQQAVLMRRLSAPVSEARYRQAVIDLSRIRSGSLNTFWLAQTKKTVPVDSPMFDWVDALTARDGKEKALARWRSRHETVWLVAAITLAAPGDAAAPELIAAAKEIAPDSPAYTSVTYQRLRLAGAGAGVHDELTALMPRIERTESRSTINRFAELAGASAPSLEGFLRSAAQVPASLSYDEDPEGIQLGSGQIWFRTPVGELCGVDTGSPAARHFAPQTAVVLNQRMPLRLLREAALSNALPKNLQFELAHVAWTRAVLLEDAETARSLSPLLAGCQPAFKPWLDSYNAAKTREERQVAGLFALMRFTSTEPMVRSGVQRDFAAYDAFRDNWWCGNLKKDAHGNPVTDAHYRPLAAEPGYSGVKAELFGNPVLSEQELPSPPFLSAQDRADAAREVARLQAIPGAPDYFATEALAWYKAHPGDKRNADLLGFAKRVVRNGCRTAGTTELDHQLFAVLQQRYPNSEWAKRYSSWE